MSAAPRRLAELLEGIVAPAMTGDIVVRGLTLDSRRVHSGDAFVARFREVDNVEIEVVVPDTVDAGMAVRIHFDHAA